MKFMNLALLLFGISIFVGCASNQKINTIDKEEAIIQISRISTTNILNTKIDVYDFNTKVAEVFKNSTSKWTTLPGTTCLTLRTINSADKLAVKCFFAQAGEITKLRFDDLSKELIMEDNN